MTTEEKAKAYDEALKRIKKYYDMGSQPSHSDLECIFPQLCESEDEWIPKELIEYLKQKSDYRSCWIAWLEKQKEQKPAWSEEDKKTIDANHIINSILSALSSGLETDEILKARGYTYDDVEKWLNSTRNPAIEYIRGQNKIFENPEKYGLCKKPAEWSEEDETALDDLMWCIEQARKSAKDENDMGNIWFAENWVKNKLKSLRPSWKPSEQEKGALRTAIYILAKERNSPKAAAHLQNILNTFKDEESRNDWKPSEEQMRGLKFFLDFHRPQRNAGTTNWREYDAVESLYEQIRKL